MEDYGRQTWYDRGHTKRLIQQGAHEKANRVARYSNTAPIMGGPDQGHDNCDIFCHFFV